MTKYLIPYYKLVSSVHKGNMAEYKSVVAKYEKEFI